MKRTEPSNWTPLQGAGRLIIPVVLIFLLVTACVPAATPTPAPEVTATLAPPTEALPTATSTATAEVQPDPAYYAEEPIVLVPTPEAGVPIVTARYNTVVRSGPGTNYPVYGAYPGGSSAQGAGVSEDKNWWAITIPLSPNGTGWVPAQYVTVTGGGSLPVLPTPPAPPTVEFTPPTESDPQATTLAEVYVRTGPGTEYPAYGVAKKGQTAKVLGKSQDGQYWIV